MDEMSTHSVLSSTHMHVYFDLANRTFSETHLLNQKIRVRCINSVLHLNYFLPHGACAQR